MGARVWLPEKGQSLENQDGGVCGQTLRVCEGVYGTEVITCDLVFQRLI